MCIRDSIKAIAVIGPNPGSIPIIVPAKHPIITIMIFFIDSAVFKPIRIPSIIQLFLNILKVGHVDKCLINRVKET